MTELQPSIRVRAEGAGITCKSFATLAILLYDAKISGADRLPLVAFAGGQLAYAVAVLLMYRLAYPGHLFGLKRPVSSKCALLFSASEYSQKQGETATLF